PTGLFHRMWKNTEPGPNIKELDLPLLSKVTVGKSAYPRDPACIVGTSFRQRDDALKGGRHAGGAAVRSVDVLALIAGCHVHCVAADEVLGPPELPDFTVVRFT